jgi:hypothetical protein
MCIQIVENEHVRARLLTLDHSRVIAIGEVTKELTEAGWSFYFEPFGSLERVLAEADEMEFFKLEIESELLTVTMIEPVGLTGLIKFGTEWVSKYYKYDVAA